MATLPTVDEIKDYKRNSKPTEDNAFYQAALDAAVQTMNDACERNFTVAGAAAARTFVPDCHSDLLRIGDCTTVTLVVENGVTLTVGTHYQLEPVNVVNPAGLTVPYNALRRLDGTHWYTNNGRGTVVVTATWGFATIPVRVVEAIKIIAKDIIENRDARAGLITLGEAGVASIRANPTVVVTIGKYRGRESWGIA
jgi:hypothetical protein